MEGEKRKILIIDDDAFILDMYALKFSQNGLEVYTSSGGEQALEKLKGGLSPEIILLDIMMPGIDGFEVLKKINEEKLSEKSVKIILSNKGQKSDIEEGIKLGAAGYIIKANSTPTEVISQVVKIFEESKK
ncbi:MAG: response regulator [Patescibacteria group bacterium]